MAAGLIVPPLGHLLERPFARIAQRQPNGNTGGFVLGLGLGALFVPCAGPVLTAISVVSAHHRVGLGAVVLTVDFALGAAVPLLVFALAGQRVAERVAAFRSHAALARQIGGVVLLDHDAPDRLQRHRRPAAGRARVHDRAPEPHRGRFLRQAATGRADRREEVGEARQLRAGPVDARGLRRRPQLHRHLGVAQHARTDRPCRWRRCKGKVVLVDFWTYSCINCQRSLPHVESWYSRYRNDGFVVVGVHTPEFAFEHVVSNVTQAAQQLGVHYPIAVDNGYKTWDAYQNNAWPAEYLIDATGQVRHDEFGEGDYGGTESLIRTLLVDANPKVKLPPSAPTSPTRRPRSPSPRSPTSATSTGCRTSTARASPRTSPRSYKFPSSLPPDALAFAGTWTVGAEKISAGPDARLELAFTARPCVPGPRGHGHGQGDGGLAHPDHRPCSGIPRLYTLVSSPDVESATLVLNFSPGVDAYDFTFG